MLSPCVWWLRLWAMNPYSPWFAPQLHTHRHPWGAFQALKKAKLQIAVKFCQCLRATKNYGFLSQGQANSGNQTAPKSHFTPLSRLLCLQQTKLGHESSDAASGSITWHVLSFDFVLNSTHHSFWSDWVSRETQLSGQPWMEPGRRREHRKQLQLHLHSGKYCLGKWKNSKLVI